MKYRAGWFVLLPWYNKKNIILIAYCLYYHIKVQKRSQGYWKLKIQLRTLFQFIPLSNLKEKLFFLLFQFISPTFPLKITTCFFYIFPSISWLQFLHLSKLISYISSYHNILACRIATECTRMKIDFEWLLKETIRCFLITLLRLVCCFKAALWHGDHGLMFRVRILESSNPYQIRTFWCVLCKGHTNTLLSWTSPTSIHLSSLVCAATTRQRWPGGSNSQRTSLFTHSV